MTTASKPEKKTTFAREQLSQAVAQAEQAIDQIRQEYEATEQKYQKLVNVGRIEEAVKLKAALKELQDQSETAVDRLAALQTAWPKIQKTEAGERLPLLVSSFERDLESYREKAQAAEHVFREALQNLEAVRASEADLKQRATAIERVAAEAHVPPPSLQPVPQPRFDDLIHLVNRLRQACSNG